MLQRYWHTLRYLKPVQFYGRAWQRLYQPRPRQIEAMPLRQAVGSWQGCARVPTLLEPNHFRFLNVERELLCAEDWNRTDWPKLWLYNLHYFNDLMADGAEDRLPWHRSLIARWIKENPPPVGNGWEPYPISLRLVNWCQWVLAGNAPLPDMLDSMAVQTHYLRRRLEHHLLGNHLWANLKALIFCGTLFVGHEADRWRLYGLRRLRRELAEQVLADGGHFERSPMYHAILLADMLDLLQLAQCFPGVLPADEVQAWQTAAQTMLDWLHTMTHSDGKISFFNDAAFGIAPEVGDLLTYAQQLGLPTVAPALNRPCQYLAQSGYARLRRGLAVLLADLAPVGPDYLPGHAHADTLSFELSLGSQRVLVNAGTSTYEANTQRQNERSTAWHNTVEIDGKDSSEVWGAFRVARRARVVNVAVEHSADGLYACATHDGYRRLPGRVLHRRSWRLDEHCLVVEDRLEGQWQTAVARFRVAPGFEVMNDSPAQGWIRGQHIGIQWQVTGGEVRIEDGFWHPEFGLRVPCKVLVVTLRTQRLLTRWQWIEA